MATQIVPLRESFPRYHATCDRCDCTIHYGDRSTRTERETPAGSFKFHLCGSCVDNLQKMNHARRYQAETRAVIRHAQKYSAAFAQFLSDWYGVRPSTSVKEA